MKVSLIGHASILIEAGGLAILSDPWWRGPCFGAQWWNFPLPDLRPIAERRIDYIYVSHGHHDHFHPGTLSTLRKDAKVLVSEHTGLAQSIRELGFEVIPVANDQTVTLGSSGVKGRILETHAGDTLMTLDDGAEVCVNINDALHSAPDSVQRDFVGRLKQLHPRIDYVFCGYGVASHFPNCYVIPGKDSAATAARRQAYFNRQWARLIAELQPRYGFPFAADVALLEEDLFWTNEATFNCGRPTDAFRTLYPDSSVEVKDIAPGFEIQDGKVMAEVLRKRVSALEIRRLCAEQIERANRYSRVDEGAVGEVIGLLQKRLEVCAGYLSDYDADYRFLIKFHNATSGICIERRGRDLSLTRTHVTSTDGYDLVYTTRLAYLRWALTRPYGDEILFVGSGGIFRYADPAHARRNLHRELISLLRAQEGPPPRRHGSRSSLIFNAKKTIKRMLGAAAADLYDLHEWTVFKPDRMSTSQRSLGADVEL